MAELTSAAIEAWQARKERNARDQEDRRARAIKGAQDRAAAMLKRWLELDSNPADWSAHYFEEGDTAYADIELPDGMRLRWDPGSGFTDMGAPEQLRMVVEHPPCGLDYPAVEIAPAGGGVGIERLGAILTGDVQLEEHRFCPADRRCVDESCLRTEPHYGHRPDPEAAELAAEYPEVEEPAPLPGKLAHSWAPDDDAISLLPCARRIDGQPCMHRRGEHQDETPDEKLGRALAEWMATSDKLDVETFGGPA
jgi:hypothetical protein